VLPKAIVDRQVRKLRLKEIVLVKVKWKGHSRDKETLELEDKICGEYPYLFNKFDKCSSIFVKFWGQSSHKVGIM
jgi:hypothetical protein